ncbi:MAG: putative toxin-antitoxin system toxin component, PIN family [Chloracidobacterium sp.]|nr:putative toxin-antitoxin system toxin component, PIN family [Chloracidobacterium sp.]
MLVAEFSEVIERPHLDRKFSEANATRRRLVSDYRAIVTVVNVAPLAERVSRDFDDDEVLACALAADCEFIVTGDKDLLVLSEYRGIRILNPTDFLAEIEL